MDELRKPTIQDDGYVLSACRNDTSEWAAKFGSGRELICMLVRYSTSEVQGKDADTRVQGHLCADSDGPANESCEDHLRGLEWTGPDGELFGQVRAGETHVRKIVNHDVSMFSCVLCVPLVQAVRQ